MITPQLTIPIVIQPLSLMPVQSCRVRSSEASSKTICRQTRTLTNIRACISGGDSITQMQSEVKALTKEERETLLREAQLPIEIPPNHALAIKADLAIPWEKMRKVSR